MDLCVLTTVLLMMVVMVASHSEGFIHDGLNRARRSTEAGTTKIQSSGQTLAQIFEAMQDPKFAPDPVDIAASLNLTVPELNFVMKESQYMENVTGDPLAWSIEMIERVMLSLQNTVNIQLRRNSGLQKMPYTENRSPLLREDKAYGPFFDISNSRAKLGMRQATYLVNGYTFETATSAYKLRQPNHNSSKLYETVDIPLPGVPDSVTNQPNITKQIEEMLEYFWAFRNQDETHRQYKPYFKPNLCYMEFMFTKNLESINQDDFDDWHFLDAEKFDEMSSKKRFQSFTGRRDIIEAVAALPFGWRSKNEVDGIKIKREQMMYRMLCQPLTDFSFFTLRWRDDLRHRLDNKMDFGTYFTSPAARFVPAGNPLRSLNQHEGYKYGDFDGKMYTITGLDNDPKTFRKNDVLDVTAYDMSPSNTGNVLNHVGAVRTFSVILKGAMGETIRYSSMSDKTLFIALNNQSRIPGITFRECTNENCTLRSEWEIKVSYIMPLEIVYTNPLINWNPYNISHFDDIDHVTGNGARDGSLTDQSKAFLGSHEDLWYRTPAEFFGGSDSIKMTTRDIWRGLVGIKVGNDIKIVGPSGNSMFIPTRIGPVRCRFPILSQADEGGAERQYIDALTDLVIERKRYEDIFRNGDKIYFPSEDLARTEKYKTQPATIKEPGHFHYFMLSNADIDGIMNKGLYLKVKTLPAGTDNHFHYLTIRLATSGQYPAYIYCDGKSDKADCDGHGRPIVKV